MVSQTFEGRGHTVTVDPSKGRVIKIPRKPGRRNRIQKSNILYALDAHREYLGENLLETEYKFDDDLGYTIEQEYFVGEEVDLLSDKSSELTAILEVGLSMERETGLLFDLLGLPGSIDALVCSTDQYDAYAQKLLLSLGKNALALRLTLKGYNDKQSVLDRFGSSGMILTDNLLVNDEGRYAFIDPEYRPLDLMHLNHLIGSGLVKSAMQSRRQLLNR